MIKLISRIKISWDLFFLIVLGFFTRFLYLSYPYKVVFDEAHFGLYATKYLSHQYYFDIHPPLGKMLFGFFAFLGKIKPGFDFTVDSPYGDINFLALRFLPAFLGSFLIVLIYLFVKELGFSKRVAFLSGFMVLFDNALLTQSRLILMDVILVFFIFLSLYLFILSKRFHLFSYNAKGDISGKARYKWYLINIFLALALGIAISIKWTGFGVLGIVWFLIVFQDRLFSLSNKEKLIKIGLLFIFPILFYFLIFAVHFYLLPKSCTNNCGAMLEFYLHPEKYGFKNVDTSYGNNPPPGQNLFVKFIEANKMMFAANLNSDTIYDYQSDWYSWPFIIRPVKYFEESYGDKTSFIYFLGNPLVWWLGIVGIIGYFYLIIRNFFYNFKLNLPQSFYSKNIFILILGYFAYTIPFASVERFMLIYHYLPALIFSIILFAIFFEGILETIFKSSNRDKLLFSNRKANFVFLGILIIIFISFSFFSSLTYGLPITNEQYQQRMWLDTWEL